MRCQSGDGRQGASVHSEGYPRGVWYGSLDTVDWRQGKTSSSSPEWSGPWLSGRQQGWRKSGRREIGCVGRREKEGPSGHVRPQAVPAGVYEEAPPSGGEEAQGGGHGMKRGCPRTEFGGYVGYHFVAVDEDK